MYLLKGHSSTRFIMTGHFPPRQQDHSLQPRSCGFAACLLLVLGVLQSSAVAKPPSDPQSAFAGALGSTPTSQLGVLSDQQVAGWKGLFLTHGTGLRIRVDTETRTPAVVTGLSSFNTASNPADAVSQFL